VFPSLFKHACVISLLKKSPWPANDLNSYRPIYNLSFIYKVLENPVTCLNVHLNCNHLYIVFQSAYKQFRSTENALLKVHNDISLNMGTGTVTAITLLDVSAGFDTIDYSVILDRLSDWYDMSRIVLTYIRSFLINSFQSIQHYFFVLRLFSWTTTVYFVYRTTKLSYSQPQFRPSFICTWHPSIHIFIYNRHCTFP